MCGSSIVVIVLIKEIEDGRRAVVLFLSPLVPLLPFWFLLKIRAT